MGKKKRPAKKKGNPSQKQTVSVAEQAAAIAEEEIAPLTAEEGIPPLGAGESIAHEPLIIGDEGYEQRAIDRRLTELGQLREEAVLERKEWMRSHRTLFIVIASVIVIVLIFIGMKYYNDANNPLSRFNSASAKNLGSSFSFRITADQDDETLMAYDGVMKVDPSGHRVEIAYDAEYTDYSYRNVLYTDGDETYKGNFYNGQWTVSTVTDKVSDFFDFYTDYRVGRFDGGSFLRFTELTSDFASYELTDFVNSLKGRFAADSPAAKITSERGEDGSTTYRYDLSLIAIADIIRSEGAPAFFRSRDYDAYVAKLEANRGTIKEAECTVLYTITSSGYLSYLEIDLLGADRDFILRCEMRDFGTAVPDIPDAFYQKAHIEAEN